MHKSYISNNLKGAFPEYKRILHCEGYIYNECPSKFMEPPSSEPFLSKRMKTLTGLHGFMLYAILGVDFFSTSELLYPMLRNRLPVTRARPNF